MRPLCYLAGPIAGLQYDEATDWRHQARYLLGEREIETLDPMRAKKALSKKRGGQIAVDFHEYENEGVFFTSRAIMARDFNDVKRSDAGLVNLLGTTKFSAGTVMELGWYFALQKPVVVAIEKSGNPHGNHPMLCEAMPFRVETIEEAIDAVATILNR